MRKLATFFVVLGAVTFPAAGLAQYPAPPRAAHYGSPPVYYPQYYAPQSQSQYLGQPQFTQYYTPQTQSQYLGQPQFTQYPASQTYSQYPAQPQPNRYPATPTYTEVQPQYTRSQPTQIYVESPAQPHFTQYPAVQTYTPSSAQPVSSGTTYSVQQPTPSASQPVQIQYPAPRSLSQAQAPVQEIVIQPAQPAQPPVTKIPAPTAIYETLPPSDTQWEMPWRKSGHGHGNRARGCDPKWTIFGDVMYMRVHGGDIPYAQPFDGVGPLAIPRGRLETATLDWDLGYRGGFMYAISDRSWIVATGTYFKNDGSSSVTAPIDRVPGSVLRSNVVFPATVNAAFVPLSANARYDVRLWNIDLDYKCALVCSDHLQLNWLAGARYANLSQDFVANYSPFGTTTVSTDINFQGVGPRAGLEGEYCIRGGFYGFGKGTANLLVGRFSASYLQTNTFAGQQAFSSFSSDRIVPVLEAELGFGWKSSNGRISVSTGYYLGSYLNTLTTPNAIQGIQNNNFTTNGNNFRDNLTIDGVFARFAFKF